MSVHTFNPGLFLSPTIGGIPHAPPDGNGEPVQSAIVPLEEREAHHETGTDFHGQGMAFEAVQDEVDGLIVHGEGVVMN